MKAILFDLDGTLLKEDKDSFTKLYFKTLLDKFSPLGFNSEEFLKSLLSGLDAMKSNNGTQLNEMVFWNKFASSLDKNILLHKETFTNYYENEFNLVKNVTISIPDANKLIKELKGQGYKIVLASNPVFPKVAQEARLKWAGVDPNDFDYITSYENSYYAKPNLKYYEEILKNINCSAKDCLMVGNDVSEDMVAGSLGLKTFLLTDCLINKNNLDITHFNKGGFRDLQIFINKYLKN